MLIGFNEVRTAFETLFSERVQRAFRAENRRLEESGKDPFQSLDKFLAEAGGDAARRTYYRVMAHLEGRSTVAVREGAFCSLANSVLRDRVSEYDVISTLLGYSYTQMFIGGYADKEARVAEDLFSGLADKEFLQSVRSRSGFERSVMAGINNLRRDNQCHEALIRINTLIYGVMTHSKRISIDEELRDRHVSSLCRAGALISIETNNVMTHALYNSTLRGLGNKLRVNRINYHYGLSQNKLEWHYSGSAWQCSGANDHVSRCLQAFDSNLFLCHEEDPEIRRTHEIASELSHAFSYSFYMEGKGDAVPGDTLRRCSEPPHWALAQEGYDNVMKGLLPRHKEFAVLFEREMSRNEGSIEQSEKLFSFWLACGNLLFVGSKSFDVGFDVWRCLQESKAILVNNNIIAFGHWCDWYLLCARAMKASGNDVGNILALARASEIGEKLGTGGVLAGRKGGIGEVAGRSVVGVERELLQFLLKVPPCFKKKRE